MPERITAVLDQIEAEQQRPSLPKNVSALNAVADGLSWSGTANASADESGD
jgi:hypothetical protein